MIRIMLDTNIILDVLIHRQQFYEKSCQVLDLCENDVVSGFVCATTMTDIFYYLHKNYHDNKLCYDALGTVFRICKIAPVTRKDVKEAYLLRAKDFEDALLALCAQAQRCDYLVTRNKKDFVELPISALEPAEFLAILEL